VFKVLVKLIEVDVVPIVWLTQQQCLYVVKQLLVRHLLFDLFDSLALLHSQLTHLTICFVL
jgi:hypothetical protein